MYIILTLILKSWHTISENRALLRPRPISIFLKIFKNKKTMSHWTSRPTSLPHPEGPLKTGCADLLFGRTSNGSLMRIYYPTDIKGITENCPPWFLGFEYTKGLAKFAFPTVPLLFEMLFNWQTKSTKIPSLWEAPLAKGKFPLVIFSHGLSAHRGLYSIICNDLASHGFFVAALEHRDESACGTFTLSDSGEKEWIYYRKLDKNVKEYSLRNSQVKIRSEECTRALDILEKLNCGESLKNELPSSFDLSSLQDRINISQPIIAGHSFGGATVILTLSNDKRFKLGLSLDPWMFPLKDDLIELKNNIAQPMLIILTETFQNQPNFEAYKHLDSDRNIFVTLKGSVHQNQSDTPFLFGFIGKAIGGCNSKTDARLAMTLNNKMMINYIAKHLGLSHANETLNLAVAQQHLQIGLKLVQATIEETEKLLRVNCNNNIKNNLKANNIDEISVAKL